MPSWTKDQSLAINTRGGKVIVSAAAGSGKTAVLSERVIKLIMEGVSVDKLLIVTFTNAASLEMKTRIKDKIEQAYKSDPKNDYLKKQLSLIPTSKITTMDAFYGELVKNNFEKIGIDKDFSILSNEEEVILKDKILKKVIEKSFDDEKDFEKLLDTFGIDKPELFKSIILKIDSFLKTLPYPNEFIKQMINNYNPDNDFYKSLLLKQVRQKMKGYDDIYSEIIDKLYDESEDFDNVLELARKERNYVTDILAINDFDTLSSRLRTIEFDTLRTPKGHKDDAVMVKYKLIRDELKKDINKNYNELKFITEDVFKREQEKIRSIITCLFSVTTRFEKLLLEEKKKQNAFSFGDIAHFVIDLLIKDGKKTLLAKEISKKYKEILIDEYQDTNNLQNVIFNAISDNDNNLFIVGDVKQSIYRFRSACPEIFNNDKANASKESFPKLITLSKNFRSRKEVLDFCNFVFENTMSELFGEVDYDTDEKLYLGASFENSKDLETEVLIIDGMEKDEDKDEDLSKTQKEAIIVAERIRSLLASDYKVYDNKKGLFRNIKPSDIVILLRSLKNSEIFASALRKRNISVYMESSLQYFDNYEVRLIIDFLKIIDNPYDDISLMSVLNSSLIDVTLDEIVSNRIDDSKISLYESLTNTNNEKLNNLFKYLNELRSYSFNHLLSDTLTKLYKEFNVVSILSAGENGGHSRYKNLMQMINHASEYEKDAKKTLHEFIIYLENVILSKGSLEGVNPLSEGENVLITTIHKSKGLEYPVVFLSETGKNFNFKDVRSDVMINETLGFVCNLKDNEYRLKYESVPIMAFKEYEKEKMLSEELRILYVALTRAKEKIIITGFTNNLTNLVTKAAAKIGDKEIVSRLYLKDVKNYLDILVAPLLRHPSLRELRSYSMVLPKTFATESKINLLVKQAVNIDESEFLTEAKKETENFDLEWFKKVSEFKYESDLLGVPKYLSVSELKQGKRFLKKPKFLDDGISHTDLGVLYHKILELLPVKRYNISSLKEALDDMANGKKITKEELKLVKQEDVFAYLTSDIYDEIVISDYVYKEMPINFEISSSYYDKSLKSGKILVSGVVDLLYVKDDVYTIVDYKTDNVSKIEELEEMYKKQLDLYEFAIKEKMNAKNVRKFIYSIKLKKFIEV